MCLFTKVWGRQALVGELLGRVFLIFEAAGLFWRLCPFGAVVQGKPTESNRKPVYADMVAMSKISFTS